MNGVAVFPSVYIENKFDDDGNEITPEIDTYFETSVTLKFSKNSVRVVRSDQFDIESIPKSEIKDYPLPDEYYLMTDLYYPDTSCTLVEH